jgi:hypothetical protein
MDLNILTDLSINKIKLLAFKIYAFNFTNILFSKQMKILEIELIYPKNILN